MSNSVQLPSDEDVATIKKKEKREKKEKKERKSKSKSKDDQHNASDEETTKPSKKRKRETLPDEIEIDVSLPEPASKKAARKAKKSKLNPTTTPATTEGSVEVPAGVNADTEKQDDKDKSGKRSQHGIWVGNLPWSATKDSIRKFFTENTEIKPEEITRVHMPAPTKPPQPHWKDKPMNKGFAYVDFSTELAMYSAIALTETKMDGRALLIKNAKNFEGRPDKPKTEDEEEKGKKAGKPGHPPNRRVFVGNLAFETEKDDLVKHFGQCGQVADIHMATFEDTGKCKGYAWVTFEDVEAATSAVKGWVYKFEGEVKKEKDEEDEDDEGEDAPSKGKKRKWRLNKLMGRDLRCEFAEDSTTRYNKRYGKENKDAPDGVHPSRASNFGFVEEVSNERSQRQRRDFRNKDGGRGRGKVDPRTIKAGAAHMNAQRASQAIVEGQGKKITFD